MAAFLGGILAFCQRIVIGVAGTGFSELHPQFFEQSRHLFVDVFRAIVRMEAFDGKGELIQQLFQCWDQEAFTDAHHRHQHLKLRHLVHGINVVNALFLVQVPLVNRINADVTRLSVGGWLTALANRYLAGAGFGVGQVLALVAHRFPQQVNLCHGNT